MQFVAILWIVRKYIYFKSIIYYLFSSLTTMVERKNVICKVNHFNMYYYRYESKYTVIVQKNVQQ